MSPHAPTAEDYGLLANDLVLAFDAHDEAALQRVNAHYQRSFTFDDLWAEIWRRVYSFRQRAFRQPNQSLHLDEAQLTYEGLLLLARMPQLESLNLSEYPGGRLTDRGLDVLRHLPYLRAFEMTWQRGITDAGVANLRHCDRLERVDLMGSPTGDGAIEALQGKPKLSYFSSGRLVTDAGLILLQNFPMLKRWHGGEIAP